jgi:hypothetical protein
MTEPKLDAKEQKLTIGQVHFEVAKWGKGRQTVAELEVTHPTYDWAGASDTMAVDIPLESLAALLRTAGYTVDPPSPRAALLAVIRRENTDPDPLELSDITKRPVQEIRRALISLAKKGFTNDFGLVLSRRKFTTHSTFHFNYPAAPKTTDNPEDRE